MRVFLLLHLLLLVCSSDALLGPEAIKSRFDKAQHQNKIMRQIWGFKNWVGWRRGVESIEGRRDADEKENILFMCEVADDADLAKHHQDDYLHSLFGFQIKYKNNMQHLQLHLFADHKELLIF